MTDLERANTLLNYGIALGADGMTYQQAVDYTMRDIAAIREDERQDLLKMMPSFKEATK